MSSTQVVLGIDIGGTNTAFGLVDEKGKCYLNDQIQTDRHSSVESFLIKLFEAFNLQFEQIKDDFELIGIGLGAPSANYFKGTIDNPTNFSWGYVDIVKLIQTQYALPVVVTNDANAAAIGELKYGAAKGLNNFIEITLGTGLGSGIVVNGSLFHGHDGFAGELGHMIIEDKGRICNCGRRGCLETYVSANGIRRTVFELLSIYSVESCLRDYSYNSLTSKLIYEAALKNDEIAKMAFERTAEKLGKALANYVVLLNPEAIVLFGGLALAGDQILGPLNHHFENSLLNLYKGKVKILLSSLMEYKNAAILGAAAIIWEEIHKKSRDLQMQVIT